MTSPATPPQGGAPALDGALLEGAAVVGGVDVDGVAAAVTACPAVARLAGGAVATYLPGRRVAGVSVRAGDDGGVHLEVHVVARYGPPVTEVADQVRAAVAAAAPGAPVDVAVDDLAVDLPVAGPEAGLPAPSAALAAGAGPGSVGVGP